MTTYHLFDNLAVTPSADSWASGFEAGNRFAVNAPYWVTHLGWYRRTTTAGQVPDRLNLWDTVTQGLIATISPVPDAQTIGWHFHALPGSVQLVANRVYCVSFGAPANGWVSYIPIANQPATTNGLAWAANAHQFGGANQQGMYPGSTNNSLLRVTDITLTDVDPGPGEPTTPTDVANELAKWFDPTDANRPTSDLKLYPRVAQLLDDQWPDLRALLFGTGSYTESGMFPSLGQIKDLLALIQALLGATKAGVDLVKVFFPGTAPPDWAGQVTTTLAAIQGDLGLARSTLFSLRMGAGDFPTNFQHVSTQPWDTSLAWAQPADIYVVDVTTVPPGVGQREVAGVSWRPRLGWWACLNADHADVRSWLEFERQHLHRNGVRMPGLLLDAKPGTAGTVEAWTRP